MSIFRVSSDSAFRLTELLARSTLFFAFFPFLVSFLSFASFQNLVPCPLDSRNMRAMTQGVKLVVNTRAQK